MTWLRLSDIRSVVEGEWVGADAMFERVSIDTRTLQKGDLYCALVGRRFDGHDFVEQAAQRGATALCVQRRVAVALPQWIVPDTRLALGRLAAWWRTRWGKPIVGITGSNGKTTCKEMIAAILAEAGATWWTQGNLNNDIGVPLTLLGLRDAHRHAVIEMGANHPGEIAYTANLTQPDVAVITNIGPAHIAGFGDTDGVAREKSALFSALTTNGVAVINSDDRYFSFLRDATAGRRVLTFGLTADAEVHVETIGDTHIAETGFVTPFTVNALGQRHPMMLALAGRHNIANALAAIAAGLALDIDLATMARGLGKMRPVTGRLQLWRTRQGAWLIDDSYNANPASLHAALDVLRHCPGEHWVALGAFGELGPDSVAIHADLGDALRRAGVTRLWATGEDARWTAERFGKGGTYYQEQSALIDALSAALTGNETLLIKGSRAQQMERVAGALVDHFRM